MYAVVPQPLNSPEPDCSPSSLLSDVLLHSGVTVLRAPQLDLRLCHWLVLLLTHKDNNGRGMTILYQKNNMMHCTILSLISVLFGPCNPALVLLFRFLFLIYYIECTRLHCHFHIHYFENQFWIFQFSKAATTNWVDVGGEHKKANLPAVSPWHCIGVRNTLISFPISPLDSPSTKPFTDSHSPNPKEVRKNTGYFKNSLLLVT